MFPIRWRSSAPWRFRTAGSTTILGAQLHVPATALGETWHILAVSLLSDFAPVTALETGPELAARAVAAIPHPGWYALTAADARTLPGAHAVEVQNHTSQLRTRRGDGVYLADRLLAEGRKVTLIAVDDAHFACDDAVGGWVMVKAAANEPGALLAALKAGQFYATQGPAIHDIGWDEASVDIICSSAASIMVLGRGSRAAQSVAPGQTRALLPLAVLRAGGFARVVVVDAQGRRAWSNPAHFSN